VSSLAASVADDKVESLRAAIAAGTYRPNAEAVAAAILRHWSGEATADAWLDAVDQEDVESEESVSARSDTSSR